MEPLSVLDEVARELERDPNASRIKKLVRFACDGVWESKPDAIARLSMQDAIVRLLDMNQSVMALKIFLDSKVRRINKSEQYSVIAKTIVSKVAKIYSLDESMRATLLEDTGSAAPFVSPSSDGLHSSDASPSSPTHPRTTREKNGAAAPQKPEQKAEADLFDVRRKILQKANPLRAKVTIFSALYHPFSFNEADWAILRKYDLEHFLRQLLSHCPTPAQLEEKLYGAAKHSDNLSENLQTVDVLLQAIAPLYKDSEPRIDRIVVPQEAIRKKPIDEDSTLGVFDNDTDGDVSEARVYQKTASKTTPSTSQANEPQSELESEPQNELEDRENLPVVREEEDCTISQPEKPLPAIATTADDSTASKEKRKFSIAASLKQQISLEEEMASLVARSVKTVMGGIENTLSDLEGVLEECLQEETDERRLQLKYKFLRELVDAVRDNSVRFLDILHKLEDSEREHLQIPAAPERSPQAEPDRAASATDETDTTDKVDEADETGFFETEPEEEEPTPKEIAALLDRFLKNRGISTIVLAKEECLHVILDSVKEPNQKAALAFVRKQLNALPLVSISIVKLHWRKSGTKSPVWTKEFAYTV